MPYISTKDRLRLFNGASPETPGELNFVITTLIKAYYLRKGSSYQTFNDVIGALEGAKLETYRIDIAPYEDMKRKENGEVE